MKKKIVAVAFAVMFTFVLASTAFAYFEKKAIEHKIQEVSRLEKEVSILAKKREEREKFRGEPLMVDTRESLPSDFYYFK
ncbi:MAG: hypothetical protein LBC64_09230 [Fibromonadaceae bacterium]|jgi:uncharacterized protein (DUF697 family)|nr:hypothetical protein [Fibromonadaceae bacterium]